MAKTPAPRKGAAAASNNQQPLDPAQQQQKQQQKARDEGQEDQRHLTSFAPADSPPELAMGALLAAPPHVASDGPPDAQEAAAAADGLARSAHFFSLVFSLFEDLLGCKCPLPGMQQVGTLHAGMRPRISYVPCAVCRAEPPLCITANCFDHLPPSAATAGVPSC